MIDVVIVRHSFNDITSFSEGRISIRGIVSTHPNAAGSNQLSL
jgi:hypothetical protein